jgi:hypothetical protein
VDARDGTQLRTPRRGSSAAATLAALACLIAALVLTPGSAAAASRGAPLGERSTLELPGPAGPFPDTVIHGPRRLSRAIGPTARAQSYPVLGGEQIDVSSTYYSDTEMQSVVNVLAGLVHGPEMNTLSVYVASPDEINYICGPGTLACYAPAISEMIVSGVDGSAYGVPRDYTIAHEYGHHIANNRLNPPWTALETGAKRWATYERVCQGVRKGQLFPGDEDYHYWENPGEGFAESNAHLNFPGLAVPWGYSALLRPTDGSLSKLQADIASPWSAPATVTWNGRLWPQRRNPAVHRFATPLDGQVEIQLNGPEGSNFDLYLLGPKLRVAKHQRKGHRKARPRRRVIERSASGGSSEQLDVTLCGQSAVRVEVRHRGGTGPFTVSVTRP